MRPRLQVQDRLGTWNATITQSPFTIGRRESNDLRLGAAEVSREHAEIIEDHGRYILRDRQSRYGTFLGGEPVVTECELRPGDEIRLGRSGGARLVFLGDAELLTQELTPNPREGLRQMTDLLERLRGLGPGRLLPDVLALVLDAALEMTLADRGFIMLADADGRLEFRMGRGPAGHALTDATFLTSRQVPSQVFQTGKTVVFEDLFAPGGGGDDHPQTRELGIRHIICVPLNLVRVVEALDSREEERRIGVIYLDGKSRASLVTSATRSALETLASEASMAIENARLYREQLEKVRLEQELRVAAEIQRSLLPQAVARRSYLEAAAISKPCRAIGGDFFDYLSREDPVFGFALGDVAGKGPPAALMSAMMQGMFSFASFGSATAQPAAIVATMNQALCARALEARFVTLVLGALGRDGRLTYCNAGHCPPLIVGQSGVRRLEKGGPVIGLLDYAAYDQDTITLDPGDVVVVVSDGVTEAVTPTEEEFGEPRLLEVIRRHASSDPQVLIEAVIDAVRQHAAGSVQRDDITVMAIRYLGSA